MKRLTLTVAAAALSLGSFGALAAPAGASQRATGQACQKIGMATVKSLGVFPAVAKNGLDAGKIGRAHV